MHLSVQTSGFRETVTFGKYFGVPILGKAPRPADCQYIYNQSSKANLDAWKARQLS